MVGNDGEYWRGRNIQQNLDHGLAMAQQNKSFNEAVGKLAQANKRAANAELQVKLQKCETAASNAQIAALKRVVKGEITRDDLNKVVGKDKNGEDLNEFSRIAKNAAFAKADELGVKRDVIANWWAF